MNYRLVCLTLTLCHTRGFHQERCFVGLDKPVRPWYTALDLNGQAAPAKSGSSR